jgi:protein-S-isoprenylcysteine O-methyltransferase Ste14
MFDGVHRSLALAIPIVTYYFLDALFMRRYAGGRAGQRAGRSLDFMFFTVAFNGLIILQPILLPAWGLTTPAWGGLAVQSLGLVLLAGALALHAWARRHLRQFYAERVEVLPGHQLVDTGPYALVRHPIITSFFSLAVGLFLVNPAVPTVSMVIYAFWDFGRAAVREEKLLAGSVPGYVDYMTRVPRFLPRLWKK